MNHEPTTIDCHYLRPEFAAAYLLIEEDEAAYIETNTTLALPHLLDALHKSELQPEQVRWIIVTHVHLDHAGGASALMAACPNATLLCHPRAARHLIDPSRLIRSARSVYGDETFDRLYGQINPIEAKRVRSVEDEETLRWGERTLSFMHTRGHANHHICIHDSSDGAVFSGDAFGLRLPALQPKGLYIFPSTSPTDFMPGEARAAVERIRARADHIYLTHFGRLDAVDEAAEQLLRHLDFAEALRDEAAGSKEPDEALAKWCLPQVHARFVKELLDHGVSLDSEGWKILNLDIDLNAQGIAWAARKLRSSAHTG